MATKDISVFENAPAGTLFRNKDHTGVYLKPRQSITHHLDGCVIDLTNGEIFHYSNVYGGLFPVYGHEIQW